MATFRQSTSRADDPQIHTHAVISAKVQTVDGRWLALDARYLKRHQRMLGGLYQSVLGSELTHRFGVGWAPIVSGQAEIAGVPTELLGVFSKRAADIDRALAAKVEEFRRREGRDPSRWERAALCREASADTRGRKSGHGGADLATRWQREAADAGWTVDQLVAQIDEAARHPLPSVPVTITEVVETVSTQRSSWARADVVQAICDLQRPVTQMSGRRWLDVIERAADRVLEHCVDLDPPDSTLRRASDGRSVWIEPTAPRFTSEMVLAQEEHIVSWAIETNLDPPAPSKTVDPSGLDVLQADAAASVAGADRLVLVVGPAGAGKTRMLAAAVADLHNQRRAAFGVAATAKASRVLEQETGMRSDTVAKLLHERHRPDRPPLPEYRLPAGSTLVVDEAGMLSTPALDQLVTLAEAKRWRLVLVGDHRQLQAVGRGGLFAELCANGRADELEQVHRFSHPWEAAASLLLRSGDPRALDAYEDHDRIIPGTFEAHTERMATVWIEHHQRGETVALVPSKNEHVDAINRTVQAARLTAGHLDCDAVAPIAGGEHVHVGDVVATRRNERKLITSAGEPVRNRETWTVTAIGVDGSLTVTRERGRGTVTLPADYVHDHVRLGYAATEHGHQSDTVDHSISLASTATTRRGLYVAATRGRHENLICVVTDSADVAEARDVLDGVLAVDRADIPAVTQRRALAQQTCRHEPAATSRCAIPDWFESLLIQARADLTDAETRRSERASRREQIVHAVAVAECKLRYVDAATTADRDAFDSAVRRADRAGRNHVAAQQQLDAAPRRSRRRVRHDVEVAEEQLERADAYLERTRQRTTCSTQQYDGARIDVEQARADLRQHDLAGRLDTSNSLVTRRRVHGLETWQCWANGHDVQVSDLNAAVRTLSAARNVQSPERALARTLQAWSMAQSVQLDRDPRFESISRHRDAEIAR